MLIVVALIGLLVSITFPSVSSGVDSLRLISASDSLVSFLNGALLRAERRQQVVEVVITRADNTLTMRSSEPGFLRQLVLPEGVAILRLLPEIPGDPDQPRQFLLYPGGTPPRIGAVLANRRGARRLVSVDPITGVPRVERLEERLEERPEDQ